MNAALLLHDTKKYRFLNQTPKNFINITFVFIPNKFSQNTKKEILGKEILN